MTFFRNDDTKQASEKLPFKIKSFLIFIYVEIIINFYLIITYSTVQRYVIFKIKSIQLNSNNQINKIKSNQYN
jgi:hypothetical protein